MVSILSMNGGHADHRTILSSGDHLSPLPKAAEREMLTALTARKEALMEKLMEKTLELKKLCIEEAVSLVKLVALQIRITGINEKIILDEVFVISRIIKVEVGVICRNRRLILITLNETFSILSISHKPNLIIVLLYIERKQQKVTIASGTDNLFLNVKKFFS